jgi:hypothetical protein
MRRRDGVGIACNMMRRTPIKVKPITRSYSAFIASHATSTIQMHQGPEP